MKKIITLLLVLAMVFSLCACGGSGEGGKTDAPAEDALQVGFAKVSITPDYSVSLGGFGDETTRLSEGFVDRIYATCLAFTQGEETILVYTMDAQNMNVDMVKSIRNVVTLTTQIPGDKIFVGATHSHSTPVTSGQYKEDLHKWVVEAAQKALEDRAPATVLAGTQEIPGMNFDRHYKTDKGTYYGPSFGTKDGEIVGHATETDPQMVLVKFDYTDESKKDVLMVNWQAHPASASEVGYNQISAEFISPMRDELEKLTGMQVAYFTGASGNLVKDSQIPSETHGLGYREYGTKMGQLANDALTCLKPTGASGIKTFQKIVDVEIDHSWDNKIKQAEEVMNVWRTTTKTAGDALAKTYGFTSSYQANAIVRRSKMAATEPMEINAFSVGGVGFTTGSYEMFATSGKFVKSNSPFEVTFLITGNQFYIPVPIAYDYRSYEADTSNYAKGTAEKLANAYVEILGNVK